MKQLFAINPELDRAGLAAAFARDGRVQVRDVLTRETATELREVLMRGTPWGLAGQAGEGGGGPQQINAPALRGGDGQARAQALAQATHAASSRGEYAFRYAHYPIVQAYLEGWAKDGPHDILLEHLNADPFLGLARDVTGIRELVKADAQATLFAPQHYLGRHIDSHVAEGWRVAYVLNLTVDDWHPDWGGYLQFLDEDGDVVAGYRPRFNSLNLLRVPQSHSVSYVAPSAPVGRFAITGWLRDR